MNLSSIGNVAFEFLGGCMHGRVVEGTIDTAPSLAVHPSPVVDLWVDSQGGKIGSHFRIRRNAVRAEDDLYEVVGRIEFEGELAILVEHRAEPKVEIAFDAMTPRNETALEMNPGSLFVGAIGRDFDLMCGEDDAHGS